VSGIDSDIDLAFLNEDYLVFSRLRKFLLSGDVSKRLYDAMSVYLARAPIVDWAVAERFVRYPADPLIAAAAINEAAVRKRGRAF
jgi:hypothetical protein